MAKETLTLGIVGKGETSRENAAALLGDLVNAHDSVHIILAVDDAAWNDAYEGVMDVIEAETLTYDVVYEQKAAKDEALAEIIDGGGGRTQVTQVARKVVADLEKAASPKQLLVLWDSAMDDENVSDEELVDDPGYSALELAVSKGIAPYDLTNGLERLRLGDDDAGEDGPLPDDEAIAEPPSYTRRDLEDMGREQLKEIAAGVGLELKPRAHTPTIVDALVEHFSSQKETAADPVAMEGIAQAESGEYAGDFDVLIKNAQEEIAAEIRLAQKEVITEGQKTALGLSRIANDNHKAIGTALDALEEGIKALGTRVEALTGAVEALQKQTASAAQPTAEARPERARREEPSEDRPARRPRRARRGE